MLWFVSQSCEMMDGMQGGSGGERVWTKGEVVKCVAMNPENGMKRRKGQRRGSEWRGGIRVKSQKRLRRPFEEDNHSACVKYFWYALGRRLLTSERFHQERVGVQRQGGKKSSVIKMLDLTGNLRDKREEME